MQHDRRDLSFLPTKTALGSCGRPFSKPCESPANRRSTTQQPFTCSGRRQCRRISSLSHLAASKGWRPSTSSLTRRAKRTGTPGFWRSCGRRSGIIGRRSGLNRERRVGLLALAVQIAEQAIGAVIVQAAAGRQAVTLPTFFTTGEKQYGGNLWSRGLLYPNDGSTVT